MRDGSFGLRQMIGAQDDSTKAAMKSAVVIGENLPIDDHCVVLEFVFERSICFSLSRKRYISTKLFSAETPL